MICICNVAEFVVSEFFYGKYNGTLKLTQKSTYLITHAGKTGTREDSRTQQEKSNTKRLTAKEMKSLITHKPIIIHYVHA